jgi:aminopeptidase N
MVGRDYVSGAMENTTATLHQESAYQNARELTDGIGWESTIAHELFHQWFGDLVTTESWSNITVNESMADYSETLWFEYKYGRDKGDEQNQQDRRRYLSDPNNAKKDLVRFYYADKEDVFDNVSYPKGGAIHHMLRNYVGDDAYFKSLNNYLTTNKFKPGEAHQMRLAFEEVTGKDMSWFWNQWFFGSGHPIVKIDYNYDEAGKAKVIIEQTQTTGKIFKLPIAIDIYNGASKKRYNVWVENKIDTFTFNYSQKPDLINVDGDKVMLWVKTDNKTTENFVHQWKYAPLFMDRSEALDYFNRKAMPELAEGLKDKFAPLRRSTITRLGSSAKFKSDPIIIQSIENLANTEKDKTTKAAAIVFLAKTKDAKYKALYEKNINDSSYSVAGAALTGLKELEPAKAYDLAKKYSSDAKGDLGDAVNETIMSQGTEADFDLVAKSYDKLPLSQEKVTASATFAGYLEKIQNITNVKKGIDMIVSFRNKVPEQFRGFVDPTIKGGLTKLSKAKGKEIEDYIAEKMK